MLILICVFYSSIIHANQYYEQYQLAWSRTHNVSLDDQAWGLAVDNEDNVLVAGRAYNGTNYDLVVIKYDSHGNMIWSEVYSDLNIVDVMHMLTIDNQQNIVICATVKSGEYRDALVMKLSSGGEVVWSEIFDYGGKGNNAHGITVDSNNNIIFGGYFNPSGQQYDDDYYVIKMDENGNILWQQDQLQKAEGRC